MKKKTLKVPPCCQGMTFEEFQEQCLKDPAYAKEYNLLCEELNPEAGIIAKRINMKKMKIQNHKKLIKELCLNRARELVWDSSLALMPLPIYKNACDGDMELFHELISEREKIISDVWDMKSLLFRIMSEYVKGGGTKEELAAEISNIGSHMSADIRKHYEKMCELEKKRSKKEEN